MTEGQQADQARKGLIDSVKGKAKEIVGAVTGNDSLTAEGQLDQTQAQARKEANTVEAIADAEAAEARREATEARVEGAQERAAVTAEAAVVENAIRDDQSAQKHAAEQRAQQDAAQAKTRAELDAQREIQRAKDEERQEVSAAAEEAVDAVAEHQSKVQVADHQQAEADRIRRQAEQMTNEAKLP